MIRVAGSHYEMGRQIGTAMRERVRIMVETYRTMIARGANLSWDEAILQSRKYLPFIEESYPQYLEELQGLAHGADLELEDVLVPNCLECLTSDALHVRCTSLAASGEATAHGEVLVGHNEDWLPEDQDLQYLVNASPADEPAFLSLTYGALLPNIGFNETGLAQACDTVYPNDVRLGIPRVFVARAVLTATSLPEAIKRALHKRRAAGYNHLLADTHNEIYNLEVSATSFAALYAADGVAAHSNCYFSPRMQALESQPENLIRSLTVSNRAQRLLQKAKGAIAEETLIGVLRDHYNHPRSICYHSTEPPHSLDGCQTIGSLVMNLSRKTMLVCQGNPCEGTYEQYAL